MNQDRHEMKAASGRTKSKIRKPQGLSRYDMLFIVALVLLTFAIWKVTRRRVQTVFNVTNCSSCTS